MNMRAVNDPYGSRDVLVDKLIGNAYEQVKKVAMNLDEVRYVASNMELVVNVANDLSTRTVVEGVAVSSSSVALLPLPESITSSQVQAMAVLIQVDEDLFSEASGYFTAVMTDGNLRVTLTGAAPTTLIGGTIRWLITHEV